MYVKELLFYAKLLTCYREKHSFTSILQEFGFQDISGIPTPDIFIKKLWMAAVLDGKNRNC